jgi:hypothetical protein
VSSVDKTMEWDGRGTVRRRETIRHERGVYRRLEGELEGRVGVGRGAVEHLLLRRIDQICWLDK